MTLGKWILLPLVAAATALAGCAAPSTAGHTFTAGEARRPMQVENGTVIAVREVRLEREQTGVGTGAGAVVGGVAGSNVGGGSGRIVAGVLGAVAGGVLGSHAEQGLSNRSALEITLRTDAGNTFAVVQEAGGETFAPGQRVRVLTDPARGTVRVSR